VFPSLIEKLICENPAVADCCVVGVADKDYSQGQLPFAFVVLHTHETESIEQIKKTISESCQKELPEYAQPINYRFIKELPTTGIGKIDYRELEKLAEKCEA
jgi:long-chain acyl-CoA synthetase